MHQVEIYSIWGLIVVVTILLIYNVYNTYPKGGLSNENSTLTANQAIIHNRISSYIDNIHILNDNVNKILENNDILIGIVDEYKNMTDTPPDFLARIMDNILIYKNELNSTISNINYLNTATITHDLYLLNKSYIDDLNYFNSMCKPCPECKCINGVLSKVYMSNVPTIQPNHTSIVNALDDLNISVDRYTMNINSLTQTVVNLYNNINKVIPVLYSYISDNHSVKNIDDIISMLSVLSDDVKSLELIDISESDILHNLDTYSSMMASELLPYVNYTCKPCPKCKQCDDTLITVVTVGKAVTATVIDASNMPIISSSLNINSGDVTLIEADLYSHITTTTITNASGDVVSFNNVNYIDVPDVPAISAPIIVHGSDIDMSNGIIVISSPDDIKSMLSIKNIVDYPVTHIQNNMYVHMLIDANENNISIINMDEKDTIISITIINAYSGMIMKIELDRKNSTVITTMTDMLEHVISISAVYGSEISYKSDIKTSTLISSDIQISSKPDTNTVSLIMPSDDIFTEIDINPHADYNSTLCVSISDRSGIIQEITSMTERINILYKVISDNDTNTKRLNELTAKNNDNLKILDDIRASVERNNTLLDKLYENINISTPEMNLFSNKLAWLYAAAAEILKYIDYQKSMIVPVDTTLSDRLNDQKNIVSNIENDINKLVMRLYSAKLSDNISTYLIKMFQHAITTKTNIITLIGTQDTDLNTINNLIVSKTNDLALLSNKIKLEQDKNVSDSAYLIELKTAADIANDQLIALNKSVDDATIHYNALTDQLNAANADLTNINNIITDEVNNVDAYQKSLTEHITAYNNANNLLPLVNNALELSNNIKTLTDVINGINADISNIQNIISTTNVNLQDTQTAKANNIITQNNNLAEYNNLLEQLRIATAALNADKLDYDNMLLAVAETNKIVSDAAANYNSAKLDADNKNNILMVANANVTSQTTVVENDRTAMTNIQTSITTTKNNLIVVDNQITTYTASKAASQTKYDTVHALYQLTLAANNAMIIAGNNHAAAKTAANAAVKAYNDQLAIITPVQNTVNAYTDQINTITPSAQAFLTKWGVNMTPLNFYLTPPVRGGDIIDAGTYDVYMANYGNTIKSLYQQQGQAAYQLNQLNTILRSLYSAKVSAELNVTNMYNAYLNAQSAYNTANAKASLTDDTNAYNDLTTQTALLNKALANKIKFTDTLTMLTASYDEVSVAYAADSNVLNTYIAEANAALAASNAANSLRDNMKIILDDANAVLASQTDTLNRLNALVSSDTETVNTLQSRIANMVIVNNTDISTIQDNNTNIQNYQNIIDAKTSLLQTATTNLNDATSQLAVIELSYNNAVKEIEQVVGTITSLTDLLNDINTVITTENTIIQNLSNSPVVSTTTNTEELSTVNTLKHNIELVKADLDGLRLELSALDKHPYDMYDKLALELRANISILNADTDFYNKLSDDIDDLENLSELFTADDANHVIETIMTNMYQDIFNYKYQIHLLLNNTSNYDTLISNLDIKNELLQREGTVMNELQYKFDRMNATVNTSNIEAAHGKYNDLYKEITGINKNIADISLSMASNMNKIQSINDDLITLDNRRISVLNDYNSTQKIISGISVQDTSDIQLQAKELDTKIKHNQNILLTHKMC